MDPQVRSAFIKVLKLIERSIGEVVKRDDFIELKKVVAELAEAQRETEKRISELVEAQKKTEKRLEELAEAQRKTEERLEKLAEAQRKTEERLEKLIGEHKKTREQLGGLSHTVGYLLEDRAYRSLPKLLREDFGIKVVGQLKRDYVEISSGVYEEVNILGKGERNGREIYIIGEAKTQLKKKDVDAFIKKVKKLEKVLFEEKFLLLVTYQASPKVREYAKLKGIPVYYSYQFD